MQFSFFATFFVVSVGIVMAVPMSLHEIRSCDLAACAAAIGPTAASCGFAAAKKGADPSRDVACLAGVVNNVENVPAKCTSCASTLGVEVGKVVKGAKHVASSAEHAVAGAAKSAKNAVGGAVDDVKDFVGNIF